MGAVFNKENFSLIDNYTYCFLGDGCLQEGVASEACSLAGHLKLANLVAIYDDNSKCNVIFYKCVLNDFTEITIDGDTAVSFTEDVEMRFKSYGWNVLHIEKGDE